MPIFPLKVSASPRWGSFNSPNLCIGVSVLHRAHSDGGAGTVGPAVGQQESRATAECTALLDGARPE